MAAVTLNTTVPPGIDLIDLQLEELDEIHAYYNRVFAIVSYVLLSAGIVTNVFCLAVLCRRAFKTQHFFLYKLIALAELVYCSSALLEKVLREVYSEPNNDYGFVFTNRIAAYYSSSLVSFITSGTSYWVIYLTLYITVERFAAVCIPNFYRICVKNQYAFKLWTWAACTICLSFGLNSWSSVVKLELSEVQLENRTVYLMEPRTLLSNVIYAIHVKEIYNAVLRILYVLVIIFLTCVMICQRWRQRRKLRQYSAAVNDKNEVPKPMSKKEQALVYLMIAVVVTEIIHITPREIRRVIELLYPEKMLVSVWSNPDMSYAERSSALSIFMHGHQNLATVDTLATLFDRACKPVLYFLCSKTFRTHALTMCYYHVRANAPSRCESGSLLARVEMRTLNACSEFRADKSKLLERNDTAV